MPDIPGNLDDWIARVRDGARFSCEDALELMENTDLFDLGRLAAMRREALHGDRVTYIRNLHINVTNICANECRFCAYRRAAGEENAYEWPPEKVWEFAESQAPQGVREFHIVGALNPNLSIAFYETTLRGLRERFPDAHLKALTAVEIAFLAQESGLDIERVLCRLMDAGLDSLAGGGAETLSERVRAAICPEKLDGAGYLDVHRRAHRLGLRSTSTLLFGHLETPRERIEHLCRVRELQDETGGFTAFVPLVFHPENTQLAHLPRASARTVLETIALSRLVLDNVPHLKAYWVSLGVKLAQAALAWGADDLDGTVMRENIHHSAGALSPQAMTPDALCRLIGEAGFRAVERDSLWSGLDKPEHPAAPAQSARLRFGSSLQAASAARGGILPRGEKPRPSEAVISSRARLNAADAVELLGKADLLELGKAAHAVRMRLHPDPVVTYNVDRNINTTNACESLCDFCAFARPIESGQGWVLDRAAIARKIEELYALAASDSRGARSRPQILLQGGLNPDLDLAWYEALFRWMRGQWPDLHIHALSPPEIFYYAERAEIGWRAALRRLRDAGLDSMPGGGAEILSDRLRSSLSPRKCQTADWIGIMRAAHQEGIRTTATMVIGLGETLSERIEHLERLRALQDETGGFTAFIVWTFQPRHTALESRMREAAGESGALPGAGACEYLRTLAVARLFLDNFANLQASWVTQGREIAQLALLFGASDIGSTMIEENVVAAAGARFRMSLEEIKQAIQSLGMTPLRRDFFYQIPEAESER